MNNLKEGYEKYTKNFAEHMAKIETNPKIIEEDFIKQLREQPIKIPEKTIGNYSIVHDIIFAGKTTIVVSHRNWIMMGYKPFSIMFDSDRLVHKLKKNGQRLMMSDSPQEMFLQYEAYKNARGRILTSGLGIGLFTSMVAKKEDVTEIVVIEKEEDIIKLIKPYIKSKKVKILHDDIWNFIKETNENFDYSYIDIHYSTGAMEYSLTIQPMRKILVERFPNMPVDFWGEEEMKAQVIGNPNYIGV